MVKRYGDSVKDNLNFKVIAETSEAYSVQVKRNGATIKSWTGLTGEQNLSWDGMANGQALADGSYRIVATTEKQRDRVRDAQMVVLDTVGPEFSNSQLKKKEGNYLIQSAMSDKPAGILNGSLNLTFQNENEEPIEIPANLIQEMGFRLLFTTFKYLQNNMINSNQENCQPKPL
jgi:hypothetical protein